MATRGEQEVLTVHGRDVAISNPRKIFFLDAGYTKLDVRLDRPAALRLRVRAAVGP